MGFPLPLTDGPGRAGKGGQSTTAAGGGKNGAVAKNGAPVHVPGAARLRLCTDMVRHSGAEDGRSARVSSYPAVFQGKNKVGRVSAMSRMQSPILKGFNSA